MRYVALARLLRRLNLYRRTAAAFAIGLLLALSAPAFAVDRAESLTPQIGMNLDAVTAAAQNLLVGMRVPSPTAEATSTQAPLTLQQSFQSHVLAFGLAVFLVYLVMAFQFESLLHPVIVLFTIPMALIGAAWGFYATGAMLNALTIIGVVALAGIAVNNAIVLIDAVHQARMRGTSERKAVVEASRARLRPIVIASVSTLLGLLPTAIGIGADIAMEKSIAVTVTAGIAVATFVTLLAVPVLHAVLDRKRPSMQRPTRRTFSATTRR